MDNSRRAEIFDRQLQQEKKARLKRENEDMLFVALDQRKVGAAV